MSFLRKKKPKQEPILGDSILFTDLAGMELSISVKQNGNESILLMTNKKNNLNLVLSKGHAAILGTILSEYASTNTINKSLNIIKEK